MARSGRTFIPPMLITALRLRPTVWTENPKVRRSSASADAGSQSAKPSKMKTYAVRFFIGVWFSRPSPFIVSSDETQVDGPGRTYQYGNSNFSEFSYVIAASARSRAHPFAARRRSRRSLPPLRQRGTFLVGSRRLLPILRKSSDLGDDVQAYREHPVRGNGLSPPAIRFN